VVARHRVMHRQILNQLKGEASKSLAEAGLHPFQNTFLPNGFRHTPWTEKGWGVFLDSPYDVYRAIGYVEDNPQKEGCPPQQWSFVVPYHPNWYRRDKVAVAETPLSHTTAPPPPPNAPAPNL